MLKSLAHALSLVVSLSLLWSAGAYANTPIPAFLVSEQAARLALAQVEKLPLPGKTATDFEHWTYNTATQTALSCTAAAGVTPSSAFRARGFTASGSFTRVENDKLERLCQSIAEHGLAPLCTHSTAWVEGVERVPGLPSDYLQVGSNPERAHVRGSLGCYLNKDQVDKQAFVTQLNVEWTSLPKPTRIQIGMNNSATMNIGNLLLLVPTAKGFDGQPYREPRLAVQVR